MCKLIQVSLLLIALTIAGCGVHESGALSKYPGTEEGAKRLIEDLRSGANSAQLTAALEPSPADYKAVFDGDNAAKARKGYANLWITKPVIAGKPDQTEIKIWKATSDELEAFGPAVEASFPRGYRKVAPFLKPRLTWYRWKYTKVGESIGMAFDGLVHVNGHWVWFPKPWRVLGADGVQSATSR